MQVDRGIERRQPIRLLSRASGAYEIPTVYGARSTLPRWTRKCEPGPIYNYNKAGGHAELQLYEGADHGFMTGKPNAPYAARALERMKEFVRKHTSAATSTARAA